MNRSILKFSRIVILLALLSFFGCSTEVILNAPPKDIWVVYGVLKQEADVQYIRISRGFLIEGDALEFAKNNDLTGTGLQVKLEGGQRTYTATYVDSVVKDPADGIFYGFTGLYQIETEGAAALETAVRYNLTVTQGDDPDFELTASTRIPQVVDFDRPRYTPGAGGTRCLEPLTIQADARILFDAGAIPGAAFEVRAYLDYTENGEAKQAVYGPTDMFSENRGCANQGGNNPFCYEIPNGAALIDLLSDVEPEFQNVYEYDLSNDCVARNREDLLSDAFRVEVTAMDLELKNYRLVNDPKFLDLNTVRLEYTNIVAA
ncbi:MAG: hypothetical protein AAFR59_18685, partial [Bacteroidota bacterium]